MEQMLTAVFDTVPKALKGVIALKDLHRAGDITLYATAVIAKDVSGKVSIKQASERELNGPLVGLLAGILLGELGGPLGLVIGVSFGGLVGLIRDLAKAGFSADFLEEVSQSLAPGKTALMAELDETLEAPADRKLVKLGGHVSRWTRSEFVDDQLMAELDKIETELN
jgi:uncharacterized membrane protein